MPFCCQWQTLSLVMDFFDDIPDTDTLSYTERWRIFMAITHEIKELDLEPEVYARYEAELRDALEL